MCALHSVTGITTVVNDDEENDEEDVPVNKKNLNPFQFSWNLAQMLTL